jgi:outer membrane receptor protein involved in Fe transport
MRKRLYAKTIFVSGLILSCLLMPAKVLPQQNKAVNISIKGSVIDSLSNETVPYATIKVVDKATPSTVAKAVPTDEKGNFRFQINKTGNYLMTVEFVGKMTVTKDLTLNETDKTIDLGIIRMSDNNKLLGEVVISAQKPLVKVDMDKLVYSIEDDPESPTSSVFDMLKKVPMITVDGEDNIQLKGSSGYKIYINGKPSKMVASNPKDILKSMPASSIKDVEVITDPGAKYDAEGVSGIINITTKKQSSLGGYNARLSANGDSQGGYGLGAFLTMKAGKIGFMGNFNYYKYRSPRGLSNSYTEYFNDSYNKYLNQEGNSKSSGSGQYGSGEFSYEIDSLNLINIGFGRYGGSYSSNSYSKTSFSDINEALTLVYEQISESKGTYGSTSFNIDYQKTSATVKDRLLTFSYLLDLSPNDQSSENQIRGLLDMDNSWNNQYSDGKSNEHTFQVDYTTPIGEKHTIETGAKYIIRLNESNSGYKYKYGEASGWTSRPSTLDEFKHWQNILSAYVGYSLKLKKKYGLKTGLRYEYTNVSVKYPLAETNNFGTNYSALVPSVTLSYQLSAMQNLRLSYNMRIMRPGIWQLNPFANTTDSTNISVGNPNLDAERTHSFGLNYSYFNPKFNFNGNLSYSFSNNDIEQIISVENGIKTSTYENIGQNKYLGLSVYFSWMPSSKFRIMSNMSGSYADMRANNESGLKNHGFNAFLFGNAFYTLPHKYRLSAYGGYSTPYIMLIGNGNSFSFYGLALSKDFINDKLTVSLSASDFLNNKYVYKSETRTPQLFMQSRNERNRSRVSLSVSFKFGEMKEQIKKAVRGISNDDAMSGGGGEASQGGQSQGQ